MKHGSLFSGIGGFDLAAEWMGWENVFHCEWNLFGQKVLKYYWPKAISYNDITKTNFTIHRGRIDILTGGFPCQPYSLAGKRKGKEDERHLWPEMLRAIREIEPTWVVGENVFGLVNWDGGLVFDEVQTDLEAEGYEVQPFVLPACAVNAPHRRDRVWFVAYRSSNGLHGAKDGQSDRKGNDGYSSWENSTIKPERCSGEAAEQDRTSSNSDSNGFYRSDSEYEVNASQGGVNALNDFEQVSSNWQNFPTQSPVCNGDDGIPSRLDGITFPKWRQESIKAGGNAVVPQVVYQIFKTIQQYEIRSQSI